MKDLVTITVARPHLGPRGLFFERGNVLHVSPNEAARLERSRLAFRSPAANYERQAIEPSAIEVKAKDASDQATEVSRVGNGAPLAAAAAIVPAPAPVDKDLVPVGDVFDLGENDHDRDLVKLREAKAVYHKGKKHGRNR